MMMWSAIKLPDGLRSFTELCIDLEIEDDLLPWNDHTFRIRFDLLSVILLFGDFGRRRLKLQLYLSVECCKFGLQLFQFVLLLPYLPGYLLQL